MAIGCVETTTAPAESLAQQMEQPMGNERNKNLVNVPWPVNLLRFSGITNEMQTGDELIISVKGDDIKNSLLLILNAMPDFEFDVSCSGPTYNVHVIKTGLSFPAKNRADPGGK
jgi:hypothetical protein